MSDAVAVTPELLTDWSRVSDPQISPNGSMVAYVRTPVARAGEHPTAELWCVSSDGTGDRRLTSGSGQDTSPRWSPDGKWLAFLSDRAEPEKSQLYLMPVAGGEAVQLTKRKTSVSQPSWSPDSRRLAFVAKDEPTEDEERDQKERRDALVDGEGLKRDRLYLADAATGHTRQVSPDGEYHVTSYCWSADGARLAAATTPSPLLADQRNPSTLLLLAAGDGADTEEDMQTAMTYPSGFGSPQWSPDGRTIAFLATPGRVKTGDQVFFLDLSSGEYGPADAAYEGAVQAIEWVPSGELLTVSLENMNGQVGEWTNGASSRRSSILAESDQRTGAFGDGLSVATKRTRSGWEYTYAVTRSASNQPGQVFLGGKNVPLRQITNVNPELQSAPLHKAETISWKAADGLEIFGLLYLPHSGQKPLPTVLVIHGGPASAFADRFSGNWHDWAQLLAGAGYAVLMPNPRGSVGRGAAFTDANIRDLGGKELQDDLAGLDLLIEQGVADCDRTAIAGWSHGGYITAWAVTQTTRFKAAVMGAGVSNMISDQGTNDIPGFNLDYYYDDYEGLYGDLGPLWDASPMKHITKVTTPTLVLHGEKDDRVTPAQGREFHRALKSLGVPTKLVIYPREPHGFREREHQLDVQRRIVDWLKDWL